MKQVLTIALLVLLNFKLSAEIMVDQPPAFLEIFDECIFEDAASNQEVLDYIQNNGYGVASSDCGIVTDSWEIVVMNWDSLGCGEWMCDIEWMIEDDCGSDPMMEYGQIFITESQPPFFSNYPTDLSLNCGDPNAQNILDAWIENLGGGIIEANCPDMSLDTFVYYLPSYITCPANESMTVDFEINACSLLGDLAFATVYFTSSIIEFSDVNLFFAEGDANLEFCVSSNFELFNDVDMEINYIGGTANNGSDFGPINVVESYLVEAGPAGDRCFTIPLIDDNTIEATENILLSITNLNSNSNLEVIGGMDQLQIFLADDDDTDSDFVENSVDNCPINFNPFQEDIDNDGIGDVCDSLNTVSQVTEIQDNLYLNKLYSGVILKDQSEKCWMITVQEDGSLKTTLVECPTN